MNKTKLIGISGCTNSGKSTLATLLNNHFKNSIIISQDNYFYTEDTGLVEYLSHIDYYNYDILDSINMKKLNSDVDALVKSEANYDFIFIDGFLIYEDSELARKMNKKYFLEVNENVCRTRRATRVYDGKIDVDTYFDSYVWPNYLKYKQLCLNNYKNELIFLNGTDQADSLFNFVASDLAMTG